MNKSDLRNKFLAIASASTAYDSKTYSGGLQGHCFCVAILVQKLFGGDIVTGKINGMSHAWNKLPDGECVDFTVYLQESPICSSVGMNC